MGAGEGGEVKCHGIGGRRERRAVLLAAPVEEVGPVGGVGPQRGGGFGSAGEGLGLLDQGGQRSKGEAWLQG